MSIEEKYDALLKSYQSVSSAKQEYEQTIQELRGQNEYLRKQLADSMKMKQKVQQSYSVHEESEAESNPIESESEEEAIRRPRRDRRQSQGSNDFRVEIPEFEGKLDPDEFLEWLSTVERVFEYKEVPEDKKVKRLALKLRKYASLWWTNLCAKRVRNHKGKIRTWEKMRAKLKSRFLPPSYVQDSYAQLHSLTQGNMSVDEFTREFEKLLIKCDIQEPEEQTIVRYLGGLDPRYANVVELQQYTTFDEVCVLAHKVEQQRKSRPFKREFSKPLPRNQPLNKGSSSQTQTPRPTAQPFQTPQKTQTPQRTYPPPQNRPAPTPMSARRCFKCQGLGHIAADCPNRKVVTLAEWESLKEEEEEEPEEETEEEASTHEEVVEQADEGEMLVLRRALNVQKSEKDEQRENIFHSRCTVLGKVCSLIIDSSSCANVISVSMIEKLNLQTSAHPHPYNIQWLNQSKGLQVNSRCLVTFSIGKNYQDQLWFDVIPMDACHVLLGRPWLFDRRVMHNGYLNTYSFTKDGKNLTNAPLSPSQLPQTKPTKNQSKTDLLLACSEPILKATQHEFKAFKEWILTVEDEPESPPLTHPLAISLLKKYSYLFPEEIPSGLPPKREIQHHIDLIPGAILPNKPAYRMNPKDTMEVQRQVEELVSKGLVRESLSPCAVPALLVPKKDGSMRMCVDSRAINKITIKYRYPIPRL